MQTRPAGSCSVGKRSPGRHDFAPVAARASVAAWLGWFIARWMAPRPRQFQCTHRAGVPPSIPWRDECGSSRWVIEEHELLHGPGMHPAVFGKLHCGFGEPIRLARGIQAKGIGLGFHAAGHGVGHRGQQEHEHGKQRRSPTRGQQPPDGWHPWRVVSCLAGVGALLR